MGVLFNTGSKLYGDRIVPQLHERKVLIADLHKQGHVGMNRLYSAIMTSYAWPGMQADI